MKTIHSITKVLYSHMQGWEYICNRKKDFTDYKLITIFIKAHPHWKDFHEEDGVDDCGRHARLANEFEKWLFAEYIT